MPSTPGTHGPCWRQFNRVSTIFIGHSSHDNLWAERISDWLLDDQKKRPHEQRFRSIFFLDFNP
jgi:hypothetical protein